MVVVEFAGKSAECRRYSTTFSQWLHCEVVQGKNVHESHDHPSEHHSDGHELVLAGWFVDFGVALHVVLIQASVECTEHHDGHPSHEVEHSDDPIVEEGRAAEDGLAVENDKTSGHDGVLVEGEHDDIAQAEEVPPTVDQHKVLEESELRDSKVGCVDCLLSFLSRNTDADVRFLDHANVVGTIADSQRHWFWAHVVTHQFH
mmetsp:Transcript_2404/g.6699  ORF Transcript_2404/g.6699 Transcript_2404/m.6699 type:complete len:202 (-) Transcript_2404:233-838(-)